METQIFYLPEIIYRIAWHINDPKTMFYFSQINSITAEAARYWMKTKKTQFRRRYVDSFILPNGEFHGPSLTKTCTCYFKDGFLLNKPIFYNCKKYIGDSALKSYHLVIKEWKVRAAPNGLDARNKSFMISVKPCIKCKNWYLVVNKTRARLKNFQKCQLCTKLIF